MEYPKVTLHKFQSQIMWAYKKWDCEEYDKDPGSMVESRNENMQKFEEEEEKIVISFSHYFMWY